MAINFANPWLLLLILPAALLLIVFNGKYRYNRDSRATTLFIRSLILLLLILTVAQPYLVRTYRGQSVIYLVDRSLSTRGGQNFTEWINESLSYRGKDDQGAVIAFGRNTQLLKPYSLERLPGLDSDVDGQFTSIEGAMRMALGLLPQDSNGRIVLISDGLENIGDSADFLRSITGIPVDVLPIEVSSGPEVAVRDIAVPRNTFAGQQVLVEVELHATVNTSAQLTLLWGPNLVFQGEVSVSAGVQRFSIPVAVSGQGMQRVQAIINPQIDTWLQNNQIDGLTFVQAPPRVLIIEGIAGKGYPLHDVFTASGVDVRSITPDQFHLPLAELASYRAIYLVDVPAYFLSQNQLQSLDTFVSQLGGGLVAVGGKNSFGLGLYQDTALEQLLPVKMEVEEQEDLPGLDLVLVIDRSGSMMGENLNMAKNAAINALDLLKVRDRLAVITFDDRYTIDFALTEVTDKEALKRKIEAIEIGGGTIIHPALEAAEKMLQDSVRSKHIILLSDGMEGAQYNYTALLKRMVNNGVSLSTIALGAGADGKHMEYLAHNANGRFYLVPKPGDLPGIFIQETVLAGGDYLVEEDFLPVTSHPDGRWFIQGAPMFNGYVASTAKPLAEVLLTTHRDHPLLSRWQYGLGRSMAFASDSFGLWSRQFLAHPAFADFWLDTLNWVVPSRSSGDLSLEVRLTGAGAEIAGLTSEPLAEGEKILVTVIADDNSRQTLELMPAGRGTYSANLEHVPQGVYLLSAQRLQGEATTAHTISGFAVPYPPEYAIVQHQGNQLLAALASASGGRELTSPRQVFDAPFEPARRATDISAWLLLAAIILWPVDIAVRRLGLGLALPKRKGEQPQAQEPEQAQNPGMERLLQAKKRRR